MASYNKSDARAYCKENMKGLWAAIPYPFDASDNIDEDAFRADVRHYIDDLGIKGVSRVSLHEKLTGLMRVTIVTVDHGTPRTEIWRALYGAASFKGDCGKICIAVNEDIDPDNADAILWAMAYRHNPAEDVQVLPHRGQGHGPKREHAGEEDSTLLIDATMKSDMPPLALPAREYMEGAKALWERLGLPGLRPQPPWHGYSLGDWSEAWQSRSRLSSPVVPTLRPRTRKCGATPDSVSRYDTRRVNRASGRRTWIAGARRTANVC